MRAIEWKRIQLPYVLLLRRPPHESYAELARNHSSNMVTQIHLAVHDGIPRLHCADGSIFQFYDLIIVIAPIAESRIFLEIYEANDFTPSLLDELSQKSPFLGSKRLNNNVRHETIFKTFITNIAQLL
jgi:hypothetical protein